MYLFYGYKFAEKCISNKNLAETGMDPVKISVKNRANIDKRVTKREIANLTFCLFFNQKYNLHPTIEFANV